MDTPPLNANVTEYPSASRVTPDFVMAMPVFVRWNVNPVCFHSQWHPYGQMPSV